MLKVGSNILKICTVMIRDMNLLLNWSIKLMKMRKDMYRSPRTKCTWTYVNFFVTICIYINIPWLCTLIRLYKPKCKTYEIKELLYKQGHVLHFPPYHSNPNRFELIWASLKKYVAQKNVTFNFNNVNNFVEMSSLKIFQKTTGYAGTDM